jgi:hypothetical protein
MLLDLWFSVWFLQIIVCPFVLLLLTIVISVLLRIGIFALFLIQKYIFTKIINSNKNTSLANNGLQKTPHRTLKNEQYEPH